MQKKPIWRIAEHIQREAKLAGGYSNLANLINELAGEKVVDRRKLKAIADNANLTISTPELIAIDAFFAPMGEGFGDQALFERKSLLEDVAENETLYSFMGAFQRTEEERNDVSLWDMNAYQEFLEGTLRYRAAIGNKLIDVPFFNSKGRHNRDTKQLADLLPRPRCSICIIGSTRANIVAELALAELFGIEPFIHPKNKLPFKFIWPDDPKRKLAKFMSAFQATPTEIEQIDPAMAKDLARGKSISGLMVDDVIYKVSPRDALSGKDYGIVAAQRHTNDRVRVVVAGATGPSTLAAARACRGLMTITLPTAPRNRRPDTIWAVVGASFVQSKANLGDSRQLKSVKLIGDPMTW